MITDSGDVRLLGFSLSKVSQGMIEEVKSGPPNLYMAPGILNGKYNTQADIWSLGVLLYVLVSGYLPFMGKEEEVKRKIEEADYHFNHEEFETVSDECKDLVKKLLVVDMNKRLTGQ